MPFYKYADVIWNRKLKVKCIEMFQFSENKTVRKTNKCRGIFEVRGGWSFC